MNGFVGAVSELIDEIADANLNLGASESSSLRLGLLLQDEHFAAGLANADLNAEDVPTMSVSSWIWYLRWRSSRAPAPSFTFLDALFDLSDNPVIRRGIVESVLNSLAQVDSVNELGQRPSNDWIWRQFMTAAQPASYQQSAEFEDRRGRMAQDRNLRAFELASYLLEIGSDRSITEVRELLRSSWPMRDRLVGLAYEQVADLDTYDEARANWLRRLGIDETGQDTPNSGE